jgi:hypothetical protein
MSGEQRTSLGRESTDTPEAARKDNSQAAADAQPGSRLSHEDFYMEGTFLVFTAAYHLRRGYCCVSNCRHCPYKEAAE